MKRLFTLFSIIILLSQLSLSQTVTKHVLLEEFSTCPCGFCPEGNIYAERVLEKYPNLISFTYHAGFGIDSMTIIPEDTMVANRFTCFAPAGVIDREYFIDSPYTINGYPAISRQKWDSIIGLRLTGSAEAEVNLNASVDTTARILDADMDVTFVTPQDSKDFRVNIAIIEDSVTGTGTGYDQHSYFNGDPEYPELYQKGDIIPGYVHRRVLRALPTGAWGTAAIVPNLPEVGTKYTYQLKNYKIPDKWKIKDMSVVAFLSVYDKDSIIKQAVLNSKQVKLAAVPVGVSDENIQSQEIKIYPNPASDNLNVAFGQLRSGNTQFEIFNAMGETVLQSQGNNKGYYEKLNLENLPVGAYYIKINNNGKYYIKPFVLVR